MNYCIVVAWHNEEQKEKFLEAWNIKKTPDWLILQQDKHKEGCAKTKNSGIDKAMRRGAEVVVVLDDDCYPVSEHHRPPEAYAISKRNSILERFAEGHIKSLAPQPVELYEAVTDPPSRGTPYFNRTIMMPAAASMGFWNGVPDLDSASQLRWHGMNKITFKKKPMYQRFFAFSGMNCAFRAEFWPHFKFDETVERFDDIFMGYRLQAEAYKCGYCINLNGPIVSHARQSNVWNNLKIEAENLERNEHEWKKQVLTAWVAESNT